jgi:hypothetical protein
MELWMTIERITRQPLRSVWQHEAYDFTTWLELNLDLLNEHLHVPVDPENVQREAGAGDFSVDLVAEDDSGRTVVIENQLERSNHDHLGKILTYQVMLDAEVVVWIVGDARPEHVKVFSWLNDSTPVSAYLFKLEALKIGNSAPAPLLTAIVEPSAESRQAATSKAQKTERHQLRRQFWAQLLDHASTRSKLHASISPSDGPHVSAATGVRGLNWVYGVRRHEVRIFLWIDRGKGNDEANIAILDRLRACRDQIEESLGQPLLWLNKEKNRSCTVECVVEAGGWQDSDEWDQAIAASVDTMIRFEQVLRPHLKALRIPSE